MYFSHIKFATTSPHNNQMLKLIVLLACLIALASSLRMTMSASKNVLIVGGTRFSGLYLWKELHTRGHSVSLFNRGKTPLKKCPRESDDDFEKRKSETKFITGDRKDVPDMKNKLSASKYDVVYDLGGRESADTEPLVDIFGDSVDHFVYMSSAGVYKKSLFYPHTEESEVDFNSRHKGKLNTEEMLKQRGVPFTSIRPTYIYGPYNYNPIEEFFFERLDAKRRMCVPGHGEYFTGLGHVEDLATAMAQVIGRDVAQGQIYNIQDANAVTFTGLTQLCGQAMGMSSDDVDIQLYDKSAFDFGVDAKGKARKAFPMREQHFFTSPERAMKELEWTPKFDLLSGLKDSYENDFKVKKKAGGLKGDFTVDDMILNDDRVSVMMYDGIPRDTVN